MITDHHPDDVREQIAVLRETTYRLSNDSNATHEQHENRIAALESAVSSLKLCLPPPPEELYSIGTSRKLRRLPPWCGCPHATAVCAMVDAGKMWEPANCGICQWRIISWNPTEPKTPFVPRGNNPPQPPCPPEDQDPTVTPWQLYKVASDARTKLYLKLEDIEANIDKLSKPKGFDSGVA